MNKKAIKKFVYTIIAIFAAFLGIIFVLAGGTAFFDCYITTNNFLSCLNSVVIIIFGLTLIAGGFTIASELE